MSIARGKPRAIRYGYADLFTPAYLVCSMGTAWKDTSDYPWETTRYVGGVEIVKINITLRIYSNKWHVYAGLAILNPSAKEQIGTYADSATQIFKLMIEEKKDELRDRMFAAREGVFGWSMDEGGDLHDLASGAGGTPVEGVPADGQAPSSSSSTSTRTRTKRKPILLSDRILDQFSMGSKPEPGEGARPNSHLSLLAMVDCWHRLGIKPYDHLDVAGTPVFMLWIGEFSGHSSLYTSRLVAHFDLVRVFRSCRIPVPLSRTT